MTLSRKTLVMAVATLACCSIASTTFAQFRGFGRGGMDKLSLVRVEQVQKELKVDEDSAKKLAELGQGYSEAQRGIFSKLRERGEEIDRDKIREIFTKEREKIRAEYSKKLASILNEAQSKRLGQIELQQQGVRALISKPVIAALKLSDEQVKKITEIIEKGDAQRNELRGGGRGFGRGGDRGGRGGEGRSRRRPGGGSDGGDSDGGERRRRRPSDDDGISPDEDLLPQDDGEERRGRRGRRGGEGDGEGRGRGRGGEGGEGRGRGRARGGEGRGGEGRGGEGRGGEGRGGDRGGRGGFEEIIEKMRKIEKETYAAAIKVLTDEQKKKFDEMKGAAFELDREALRRGSFRGRGGDRGGFRRGGGRGGRGGEGGGERRRRRPGEDETI